MQMWWVFTREEGVGGSVMVWSLTRPSLPYVKFKVTILEFAYWGFAPDSLTRGCVLAPRWGARTQPCYRLALCVLVMRVYSTFFYLKTPLSLLCTVLCVRLTEDARGSSAGWWRQRWRQTSTSRRAGDVIQAVRNAAELRRDWSTPSYTHWQGTNTHTHTLPSQEIDLFCVRWDIKLQVIQLNSNPRWKPTVTVLCRSLSCVCWLEARIILLLLLLLPFYDSLDFGQDYQGKPAPER